MTGWHFQVRLKGTIYPTLLFTIGGWMIIDNRRIGCSSTFFSSPHTSELEFHRIDGMSHPSQLTIIAFNNPRWGAFFPQKCVQIILKFLFFTNSCVSQRLPIHVTPHFVLFHTINFYFHYPLFYSKLPLFYSKGRCWSVWIRNLFLT